MIHIKVYFNNGDNLITGWNSTFQEAEQYYLNKTFNLGIEEDVMVVCTQIELV